MSGSGHICDIPFRKCAQVPVTYLEKPEIDALLAAPDRSTPQGRRDHAVLLFLYNTGARADEAAQLSVGDLELGDHGYASVRLRGKGNKIRHCPLWSRTVTELRALTRGRARTERVFVNRCKHPLTRFGIHNLVTRHVRRLGVQVPSLAAKRIGPHVIRHTTATHLLRAGVDINTIRAWLGHVSLATTNIYAEVDLEMKAKSTRALRGARGQTGEALARGHRAHGVPARVVDAAPLCGPELIRFVDRTLISRSHTT